MANSPIRSKPQQNENKITPRTPEKTKDNENMSVGFWTELQHQKYVIFIDFFKNELSLREYRKNNKMYKIMSNFIGSRNVVQCRNHHTKLMKTYKSIRNIVKELIFQISLLNYEQAKRNITENNPLFDRNSQDYRKIIGYRIGQNKIQLQNIGVQTDISVFKPKPLGQDIKSNQNFEECKAFEPIFYVFSGPFIWQRGF